MGRKDAEHARTDVDKYRKQLGMLHPTSSLRECFCSNNVICFINSHNHQIISSFYVEIDLGLQFSFQLLIYLGAHGKKLL